MQKCSLPRPHPLGAYGASIFAPMALNLNVTPPKKILFTALVEVFGNILHRISVYPNSLGTGTVVLKFWKKFKGVLVDCAT